MAEKERIAEQALKMKNNKTKNKSAEEQSKQVEKIKSTTSIKSKTKTFYSGRLFMHSYAESKNENASGYGETSHLNSTENLQSERCGQSSENKDTETS